MALVILLAGSALVGFRVRQQMVMLKSQKGTEDGEIQEPLAEFVPQKLGYEMNAAKPQVGRRAVSKDEQDIELPIYTRQARPGQNLMEGAHYRQTDASYAADYNSQIIHDEWHFPRDDDLYKFL